MEHKYLTYGIKRTVINPGIGIGKDYSSPRSRLIKNLINFFGILVFLSIIAGVGYFLHPKALLEKVYVLGNFSVSNDEVMTCAGITGASSPFVLHKMREELLKCSHIKNASIRAIFPGILQILVEERRPAALWWNDGQFHVIDNNGEIINSGVAKKDFSDLTLVIGAEANKNYKKITDALTFYGVKVIYVRLIDKRRWDILLSDGTLLRLPELKPEVALQQWFWLISSASFRDLKRVPLPWSVDLRLMPNKLFIKQLVLSSAAATLEHN